MRPDKPKAEATQKSGRKDEKKDLENRNQPKAASRQADPGSEDTLASARHPEARKPRLH